MGGRRSEDNFQRLVLAFYCGSEATTQVVSQAGVVSASLPAGLACRPLTGSLCGAGETNGGPVPV